MNDARQICVAFSARPRVADTYPMLVSRPTWAPICCLNHLPSLTAPSLRHTSEAGTTEEAFGGRPSSQHALQAPQLSTGSPGIPCAVVHLLLDEAKR